MTMLSLHPSDVVSSGTLSEHLVFGSILQFVIEIRKDALYIMQCRLL